MRPRSRGLASVRGRERLRLTVAMAALAAMLGAAAPPGGAGLAPWHFQTDFRAGLPAWMSFPLAQDVGYDPTIYTTALSPQPMLVRDVEAHGEKRLRVGVIRPLRFVAGTRTVLRLAYRLEACGAASLSLGLGAEDGARYAASLPATPGWHEATILGSRLHLPASGARIQALVIEARIQQAVTGSHQRLFLRSLSVDAQRPPRLAVLAPALAGSNGEARRVAQSTLTPGAALFVQVAGRAGVQARLFDPAGHPAEAFSWPSAGGAMTLPAAAGPGLWRVRVQRGAARAEFAVLVLPASMPPHPRLLLDATQWRALRDSRALCAEVQAAAQAAAARVRWNPDAGDNIALLSKVSVLAGLPGYFTLLENYSHAIAFNALDYRLTGDREALAAARRGLLTIARWRTWTPPWFLAHGLHTYYEVGVFSQRVAFGYDLIANQLTPAERATIAEAFWRQAVQPAVQEYFLDNRMPIAASNHMAHAVGGALALAVATAGDDPVLWRQEAPAVAELLVAYRRLLRGLFPGDGSEAEPAGYEEFAMIGMSWGAAALDALGIHPPGLEAMAQAFWWPRYAEYGHAQGQLHLLDTGDFGGALGALSGFAWPAAHEGSAALQAWYDLARSTRDLARTPPPVADTGRALEAAPDLLDLARLGAPARGVAAQPAAPLARIFPGRGSAVLRSGWEPGATVVSLRAGPWFNHGHADEGSFQIATGGEAVVAEAGYADYYKEPLYASYFTQAAGHNTVLIDGDPFSEAPIAGRYWRAWSDHPAITTHLFAPGMDYLAADLAPAYGGRLTAYVRDYLFLSPGLLVVRDRLRAPGPHAYTWLLHAPAGDRVTAGAARARILGEHAQATAVAAGGGVWRMQAAPVPEGDFADFDAAIPPRVTLSLTSAAASSRQFFVGIEMGEAGAATDLTAVRTPAGEGVRSARRQAIVLSRTAGGMLEAAGCKTDGDLLAVSGARVLAGGATEVDAAGGWRARVDHPIMLAAEPVAAGAHFWLVAAQPSHLVLNFARAARRVRLDKQGSAGAGRAIRLGLPAGEHRLDVVY